MKIQRKRKRGKPDTFKKAGIGNSFATFLPTMTEGNNAPLQTRAGFYLTDAANPNGWLSSISRNMDTPGMDVGYAIPDVMAGEQQIRRLIRLPREESLRHQEMRNWRAVLAILLLWDSWNKDDSWPQLVLKDYITHDERHKNSEKPSSFRNALLSAVSKKRAEQGVQIFSLSRTTDLITEICPIAVVSEQTVIAPAANMPENVIKRLLPSCVTWYDYEKNRFDDPCAFLQDDDRLRLVMQIRILQELNSNVKLKSRLLSEETHHLVGLLSVYIDDLNSFRYQWRNQVQSKQTQGTAELYKRILAVYGLYRNGDNRLVEAIIKKEYPLLISELIENPLIEQLLKASVQKAEVDLLQIKDELQLNDVKDTVHVYYHYNDIPFAREDDLYVLEPVNHPREVEAMLAVESEIKMLREHSAIWNAQIGEELSKLSEAVNMHVGVERGVPSLIEEWSKQHKSYPTYVNHSILLDYPLDNEPETLRALMKEFLNMETLDTIYQVFSDCMIVIKAENGDQPIFDNKSLDHIHRIKGEIPEHEIHYGILPISEKMATWLMNEDRIWDDTSPRYHYESLNFTRQNTETGGYKITALYSVVMTTRNKQAIIENTVTFRKTYMFYVGNSLDNSVHADAIEEISIQDLPEIVIWPSVKLPKNQWQSYFIYNSNPSRFHLWVMDDMCWKNPVINYRKKGRQGYGGVEQVVWAALKADTFPQFIILKRGVLNYGAIWNPAIFERIRAGDAITIGVDFGSTMTAIMLKQGEHVFPALYSHLLHRSILQGDTGVNERLVDEFIPETALHIRNDAVPEKRAPNILCSVIDSFSEAPDRWQVPIQDGHIYFGTDIRELSQKDTSHFYSNIKWGNEDYHKQCVQLFLRQAMLHALLVARLHGAPCVKWRFAIPTVLQEELKHEFIDCIHDTVGEVEAWSGIPLDSQEPISFLSENEADGIFFLNEDIVDIRNGYINLDIGGNTTDLSLWLNASEHVSIELSLEIGCRSILQNALFQNPQAFSRDLSELEGAAAEDFSLLLEVHHTSNKMKHQQDVMVFMLDHWMSNYSDEIKTQITRLEKEGKTSYISAAILFSASFLFYLCGCVLSQAALTEGMKEYINKSIQICIAGNGGRVLTLPSAEKLDKAKQFVKMFSITSHIPEDIIIVHSTKPKLEVATGLLLGSEALSGEAFIKKRGHQNNGAKKDIYWEQADLDFHIEQLTVFIKTFHTIFPNEAQLLLEDVLERESPGQIKYVAHFQLKTIVDNAFSSPENELCVLYANCFKALKKMWRI